jgi:hypothetical protein
MAHPDPPDPFAPATDLADSIREGDASPTDAAEAYDSNAEASKCLLTAFSPEFYR